MFLGVYGEWGWLEWTFIKKKKKKECVQLKEFDSFLTHKVRNTGSSIDQPSVSN